MRRERWLDHLCPWLAWGALASAGVYTGPELGWMALPLLLAALAEWRRLDLGRFRRPLEILALAALLLQFWGRLGLVPTSVNTLFLLTGIRLALPRELPQRRQILFMAFLLFLTTTVSTTDLSFAPWLLAFALGATLALLQLAWEPSAALRPGPASHPPYARVLRWVGAAALLALVPFLLMPRLNLGLRPLPYGLPGMGPALPGLSDRLDLGGKGPLIPRGDTALRISPPPGLSPGERQTLEQDLALLRGLALEARVGRRWEPSLLTPPLEVQELQDGTWFPGGRRLELYVAPNPMGIVSLPQGRLALAPPPGLTLRRGPGGSVRWPVPLARTQLLQVLFQAVPRTEARLGATRRALLLEPGLDSASAARWSRIWVPEELPPARLAERLSAKFQAFRYTLDNPSGASANPMEDFLERTRSGHCEYFASALALMLRARGVPARVVNGYRLGPWIEEGGYWLVTQEEAHSWVEYYDEQAGLWRSADPTPPAPPAALGREGLLAALQRWNDTLRFRWERHVVRFSDADQVAGLEWARDLGAGFLKPLMDRRALWLLPLLALPWLWRRLRGLRGWSLPFLKPPSPGCIRPLAPLLRRFRKELPPMAGETARGWLMRLAELRPHRGAELAALADAAERAAYGGGGERELKARVRAELRSR